MKCVITGCALMDFTQPRWVAGDLFDVGTHYVFNGNTTGTKCEPAWMTSQPFYGKMLTPDDYWERRGVFVIEKSLANLNQAAEEYING